jgi:hypothetical protein
MSDAQQPPDTASLWGNMFGLGPIMRLINDPQLGQQAQRLIAEMMASQHIVRRLEDGQRRIEAKLDLLLEAASVDIPAELRRPDDAVVPVGMSDGAGGHAVTDVPFDDGAGERAPPAAPAGNGVAHAGSGGVGQRGRTLLDRFRG